MSSSANLIVFVYTGDKKNAATDGTARLVLYGDDGTKSEEIVLNHTFSNQFERGRIDTFRLSPDDIVDLGRFANIERLELWKDKTLWILSDDWFLDKIVVENTASNKIFVFPFFRWIRSGRHYQIKHLDTSLPQHDEFLEQRRKELEEKKNAYQFDQNISKGPVKIKTLPPDEQFSFDYKWDMARTKMRLMTHNKIKKLFHKKWKSIDDIVGVYSGDPFDKPRSTDTWDSDVDFGRQRQASINPTIIALATSIPEKFPVTDVLVAPLLEGLTLQEAIDQKRLFLCDLKILDGIGSKPGYTLCSPFALFFVDKQQQLRPIAIQLFHEPGPENPIFTPMDDPMLWKHVKMWYNNADCSIHQALTHLGFTHLLMEGVAIASHRNLSPSHPVFKILAPHFLFIIAINTRALAFLVSEDGWINKTMTLGAKGLLELTVKGFAEWRMDVQGLLPEDLKARGLEDPNVLPGYFYRDDAMLLFKAITQYVSSYIALYYTSQETVKEDEEIQAWAKELSKEGSDSDKGVGLKGVPGNGSINCTEELVKIITCVIYTCSVAHASANFGQYDEYGFPPNYPSLLKGKPPSSKDAKLTEKDIFESLPDEKAMENTLIITTLLSRKGTNSLGDFEVQYIFDPRARQLVDQFRIDLNEISNKIKTRNENLDRVYDYLLPENIPNSISI